MVCHCKQSKPFYFVGRVVTRRGATRHFAFIIVRILHLEIGQSVGQPDLQAELPVAYPDSAKIQILRRPLRVLLRPVLE